ncbi:MAG: hypothetical protein FWE88_04150 [Phycisphaerae bacterium]|nr:hypothetical protein [Phycisphaerae bacterium]
MVRKGIVVMAVAAILVASHASAVVYTGALSTAGGTLTGTGDWASGPTSFTYSVNDQATPGFWHYEYTLTVPSSVDDAGIERLIIGLTIGMPFNGLMNVNGNLVSVGQMTNTGVDSNMPQSMFAGLFTVSGDTRSVTISFDSMHNPVWGNFFALGAGQNSIWNAGFTEFSVDPQRPVDDPTVHGYILRPNGEPCPPFIIPEPMTMLTLGLAGVALSRTLRNRLHRA